jgi:son of sevenless-like protein
MDEFILTFFCRALYDHRTNDPSYLSFRRDDIIEVLTQQESGWWDGLLGDERGWFPSNYVALISDEEAEAVLAATGQNLQSKEPLEERSALSDQDQHWLEVEVHDNSFLEHANGTIERPSSHFTIGDQVRPILTKYPINSPSPVVVPCEPPGRPPVA